MCGWQRGPQGLHNSKGILKNEFSFHFQQKPTVAKKKVVSLQLFLTKIILIVITSRPWFLKDTFVKYYENVYVELPTY